VELDGGRLLITIWRDGEAERVVEKT